VDKRLGDRVQGSTLSPSFLADNLVMKRNVNLYHWLIGILT